MHLQWKPCRGNAKSNRRRGHTTIIIASFYLDVDEDIMAVAKENWIDKEETIFFNVVFFDRIDKI